MDVQGANAARPYVRKAGAEYTTLVDSENVLADLLGLTVVPNIHLIDERGIFRGVAAGREAVEVWVSQPSSEAVPADVVVIDAVDRLRALEEIVRWVPGDARGRMALGDLYNDTGRPGDALSAYEASIAAEELPLAHFRMAGLLLKQGRRDEAIEHLRRAARMDPENYVVRKQLWAVEAPERFYSGPVDFDWQAEQMRREEAQD